MKRRDALRAIGTAVVTGLVLPNESVVAQDGSYWRISEDELKVDVLKPITKKEKKAFSTNRFDDRKEDTEKLIKIAEAVIPAPSDASSPVLPGFVNRDGGFVKLTPTVINEYFKRATKERGCVYKVAVTTFVTALGARREWRGVTAIDLRLLYGYLCGFACCYSIELNKTVVFDEKGDIVTVLFPWNQETQC